MPAEPNKALAEALTKSAVDRAGCPLEALTVILDAVGTGNGFIGAKDSNELCPGVSQPFAGAGRS